MKKEKLIMKVYRSRKSYFLYYLLILLTLFVVSYLYYKGYEFTPLKLILIGAFVLILIKFIEIHRIRDWWGITEDSFIESKSILNKNVREIEFNSISDIDLDQPLYKRLLGYGTINLRKILNEASITIKDINNPEEFIEVIQEAIKKSKSQSPK